MIPQPDYLRQQAATQRQIDDDFAYALSLDSRDPDEILRQRTQFMDQASGVQQSTRPRRRTRRRGQTSQVAVIEAQRRGQTSQTQVNEAQRRDREQFVGLLDELPNEAILDTVLPTPGKPPQSIFDPVERKVGPCPICGENEPLLQSCDCHSACGLCMIQWIEAQLPGKFIKCYHGDCATEISSERVFDIMPTCYNSLIEDFYDRRDNKLVAAPGKCPRCRTHVEKEGDGCNHMTCPCGTQFCYECGDYWKCLCKPRVRVPQALIYNLPEVLVHTRNASYLTRIMRRIAMLSEEPAASIITILGAYYQLLWAYSILMAISGIKVETTIIITLFYIASASIVIYGSMYMSVESAIAIIIGAANVFVQLSTFPTIDYSWIYLVAMQIPFVITLTINERRAIIPVCMIVLTVAFHLGYVWSAYFGMCGYTGLAVAEMIYRR